jgi:hypothetical protein
MSGGNRLPVLATIRIALIYPSYVGRSTDKDRVDALVASIKEIGLKTPITVRRTKRFADGRPIDAYEIVTGLHRYAAACRLGWQAIDCVVTDDDDLHVELWTIDENLIRAELSPSDRATATARRKEIYEELHPEARHGENQHTRRSCQLGNSNDEPPVLSFTDDTAKATGQSKRKVARDAERGAKIAPDVLDTITGSQWDKGAVLDILKKLSHDEQRQTLRRVQSGVSASFQDAFAFIRGDQELAEKAPTKAAARKKAVKPAREEPRPPHVIQFSNLVRTLGTVIGEFSDGAAAASLCARFNAHVSDQAINDIIKFLAAFERARDAGQAAEISDHPSRVVQLSCLVRTMRFLMNDFKDAAEAASLTVRWDATINDDDLAEVVDFLSSLLAQRRASR